MKPNFNKVLPVMALSMAAQAVFAGNITDINVSVLPDQQRVIKIKFDRDVVQPTGFATASPARIALDFAGTGVQFSQGPLSFNDSLLNQVMVAQSDNKARVMLGLTKEAQYNTQVKGNEVWVYVSESGSSNAPARSDNAPSASNTYNTGEFSLDFRKGANRSGVVDFRSGSDNEPKVKVQSDRVVITLKNQQISTQDAKNLDVTDFSTPVRTITARRIGNDTQITVRNQGTWTHKLTPRSGGRYTLTVTPAVNTVDAAIKAATNPKKPTKTFSGKTVSLDFQDIEVRTVLQILSKEAGMNIVASDSVGGKMTLALKDVPSDQALDLILAARDLVQEKQGNIIRIETRKEYDQKIMEEAENKKKLQDLVPLISQTFQLKYKNVEELKTVLRIEDGGGGNEGSRRSILSNRGSAMIDPATNTLIVKDVGSVIQEFQRLIEELDVPARQVMVEARIVEADVSLGRDLGVKLGYARAGRTGVGSTYDYARNNRNVGVGFDGEVNVTPNINLPLAAATSSIGIIRSIGSSALGLELSASEKENRSKTISTPRVLTQDRKKATIKQGTQIPYQTRDSDGGYTTAFKDAVLQLDVTPRITPDNNIILDIQINKDDVATNQTNADGEPAIAVKQVTTQAMVENGGTLVVGGIYQETISNNVSKVPVLGDVPVLGNLFKSRSRGHDRNEVLFFITPRIIEGQSSVMRY